MKENPTPEELIELAADEHVSQEHKVRVEKVIKLRKENIEPWPASKPVDATCKQILDEFKDHEGKEYMIAGRLMTIRLHGKTAFADIQDSSGRLQLYIRKDDVGEQNFSFFQHSIDLGDIFWAKGTSFVTKMGETTLKVHEFSLLSKCLYPLPEKFHGLSDTETRYRQRYLDLITNSESRIKFIKRSTLIRTLRNYLDSHNFMEVETPMLHPIAGGAAARPFITHHNSLQTDFYLRIAPELYLKRLVVGGFDRVYEINRNFRNEGISTRHNPEFTMVEFYMAYHDYIFIMDFVEQLLKKIVSETDASLQAPFGNHILDFAAPFKKLTVKKSVMEYGNFTEQDLSSGFIDALLHEQAIVLDNKEASLGQKIFALFEKIVEPQLIQPTFITEFPIEISPLAKRDSDNPDYAARFELFIGGMEIANGFNELNDPFDQAERFKQQLKAFAAGDAEAHQYDADYVLALEYGLPPTVGVGIGIDRLTMLATNTTSIKDVILFPTLKKK
jgi:lysyl-tRNA synthetase, class II